MPVAVHKVIQGLATEADADLNVTVGWNRVSGSAPYIALDLIAGPGLSTAELSQGRFASLIFQATAVGVDARQAVWWLDKFRDWYLARNAGGGWVNAAVVDGHALYERGSDALGPVDGDGTVRQAAERFALEVEAL